MVVDGNTELASVPGVSGAGIEGDPYIIRDKVIDGGGTGSCLWIGNTSAYFELHNCTTRNSAALFHAGIRLSNVTHGRVTECNASGNLGAGILLENGCQHVSIEDNLVSGNDYGILVYPSSFNVTITGNNATGSTWAGVALSTNCWNTSIVGNNASNNGGNGIRAVIGCTNMTIESNLVAGNAAEGINLGNNCTNSSVARNDVEGNLVGVYLGSTVRLVLVSNNNLTQNGRGLTINSGSNNTIVRNNISQNTEDGVYFDAGGVNNTIGNNSIAGNNRGIYVRLNGDNNTFVGNYITANTLEGARAFLAAGNLFTRNVFNQNAPNAYDEGTANRWDDGQFGNAWSDYAGQDPNDDGIGDTAYPLLGSAGSRDNFPLWDDGDDLPPLLTILNPANGTVFMNAPSFTLTIDDPHFQAAWYTLGNDNIKYFILGESGTIDATAWVSLPTGEITIIFHANDSLGHETTRGVIVVKEVPEDLGWVWFVGIGVITGTAIGIAILIKKTRNKRG